MKLVNFGAVDALDNLPAMEALAAELATLAGREIVAAFGTIFMVRYKIGSRDVVRLRDPVSEINRRVEVLSANDWPNTFPIMV
jgi:myo-inositol-1(or 4)-monophosphatase